jgi:hypothetical protein
LFGGVFYVQHLLPLDGHVFREEHGQIAWGKTSLTWKFIVTQNPQNLPG